MKKFNIILFLTIFLMMTESAMTQKGPVFAYDSVPGDPMKVHIYTLSNGLKVFLSVYRDAPRIQTYIAVHTGSKMDPPETTGLAHYFEHMMFKGTQHYGTSDWAAEKPMITEIENLFEKYRKEKDEKKRAEIYHRIDSLSYAASKLAIPNEYDKLMDAIGSQGSNAGTSSDYTIFQENIPANEIVNWAIIQSDRFTDPVLRIFHTELETVYEEKNMSLTNDNRKVSEAMMKALFPNHPYGTQTTLGETEHLKNPSMKNIREFFAKYYVPGNMAICMSGDLDPDQTIRIIEKYFGNMKSSPVPPLVYSPWKEPEKPIIREITGLEAESVRIGFGFDIKANDDLSVLLNMIGSILSNGKAGLVDLNINQKQKALSASAYNNQMADYGMLVLSGRPKTGQTPEEVRDLLLEQVENLKKGNFPDWMLEAAVNNAKLSVLKQYETNQGRAMNMANAFLDDIPWEKNVHYLDDLSRLTKKDIVDFANKFLRNNYAIIYKHQGQPEEVVKIKKPPITPIFVNRESESDFVKKIRESSVKPIDPVFIDYSRDIKTTGLRKVRIIYKENTENKTFNIVLYYKMGRNADKILHFAVSYLPFLGTSKHSAEEIKQEFYRLGCTFNPNCSEDETSLTLSGLSENFEKAFALMEELLSDPRPDKAALDDLVMNTIKSRTDGKSNQNEVFNALVSYGTFGPKSAYTNILSENELKNLTPEMLADKIKELGTIQHQVLYYGPEKPGQVEKLVALYMPESLHLKEPPAPVFFPELQTNSNRVVFTNYNARQARIESIVNEGKYDKTMSPRISIYNNYFGSNIVFQELREKRALAYTAYSRFQEPGWLEKSYLSIGYIATQNDKIIDALSAFNDLFEQMPVSEITFNVSKNSVLNRIRTERITKMNEIWNFINAEKLGLTYDIRKDIFEQVSGMTVADVKAFNEKFIRGKAKTYVILGKEPDMDFKALEKFGPVTKVRLEDIFGY